METINWKITGMSCANCALTVDKYLQQEGLRNVRVSLVGGEVSFESEKLHSLTDIEEGLRQLGYPVSQEDVDGKTARRKLNRHLIYLIICLPFSLLLWLPMFPWAGSLMHPWAQLAICLPVYAAGMNFFGPGAWRSIRNGMPNMNVLIALGASAAFAYSLAGTLFGLGHAYQFYETAAAIITLVLFGNYLEDISMRSTRRGIDRLRRSQTVMANMIAFDDQHQEVIFPVKNSVLKTGDLVLIRAGEIVPADAKILWGESNLDESILTGESLPVFRKAKDPLLGGSLLLDGTLKAQIKASAAESTLAGIIQLVHQVQGERPPAQRLADRISAIFVPVVLGIALLTGLVNYLVLHAFAPSLMRSIAVLVIACPCAMGLATPAAVAVGLGRAARLGILFRTALAFEKISEVKQVVFDKTGTLTTGNFQLAAFEILSPEIGEDQFRLIAWSLEKYSNHPLGRSLAAAWKTKEEIRWAKWEEIKGLGLKAETVSGDRYEAGSWRIRPGLSDQHDIYLYKNDALLGWIDLQDEIRPEAAAVVSFCRRQSIRTILLSGDRNPKCEWVGRALQLDQVLSEQTPAQKLACIREWNAQVSTAMVGDGINDAPALAQASLGISLSDASQIAVQTADLVLVKQGLTNLPAAMQLGRLTFLTIRQNLFWAFFYNCAAIPIAAVGLLHPGLAALAMGLSDVVLVVNSVRLYVRKLELA